MNITKENVDNLNAVLKIQIEKPDYEEKVDKKLKDYRKKASIKGFRPGKVPFDMIKKMVGTQILVEEINKLVYESMTEYIKNENINILGEPLLNFDNQPAIDWDNQSTFDFVFDLGLSPEINLNLTDKDKVPYYNIKVEDKMVDDYVSEYTRRYGSLSSANEVADEDMIKGDLKQSIDNNPIFIENASLLLKVIKDDKAKKVFIGKKIGDTISFDIKKAFPNNTELSSLLKISVDEVENIEPTFEITINEISRFKDSEVDQSLFDKVYGEGTVKSIEEFRAKLTEDIEKQMKNDSEYRFMIDAKDAIIKKAAIQLPVEFLKKWLVYTNEKITKEEIEEDFPKYEEEMKWQVIKSNIIRTNNMELQAEELLDYAKKVTAIQFQQYGMVNLPEEHLTSFASEMLKKDEERRRLIDRLFEDKIAEFIKGKVSLSEKKVTSEEFGKLFEK